MFAGFNTSLIAYGQTGSGKSYTMSGQGPNMGLIPLLGTAVFGKVMMNKDKNISFEIQISMLEIYKEKVQDLLSPNMEDLEVMESKDGEVFVPGLSQLPVDSFESIQKKIIRGFEMRSIGSTQMNKISSRAHTIV